jgi:hypothetical protein
MKKSTSLCFTNTGLVNPHSLKFVKNKDYIDTILLFGDGSEEALEQIRTFQDNDIFNSGTIKHIGICKTPRFEMRVDKGDGVLSDPHYLYEQDSKDKWFCGKVAAPHFSIAISDITSSTGTQTILDREAKEALCFLAHRMWSIMMMVEERLAFPAIAIDLMTKWSYNLTPQTIDIELLRKETGLSTLEYNDQTDLLSVEVAGDIFFVKLSVLNETYGTLILPLFRSLKGRRLVITVALHGPSGELNDYTEMTYGQLGRIIETMRLYIRERKINKDNPIPKHDLLEWAKRVKPNDESCVWVEPGSSISKTLELHNNEFVFGCGVDHPDSQDIS